MERGGVTNRSSCDACAAPGSPSSWWRELTHRVCDGVGVGVGDPGHLPLAGAHVGGGDINARS